MSKKLYVGNLSWNLRDDDLRKAFEEFGEVEDAFVMMDKHTNRSKGFGFVTFVNDADADKAMEGMNEKEVDGRPLKVDEARPPRSDY